MSEHRRAEQNEEPPHDVLAAEEFPVGSGDPALHHEMPHDILAAEMFEVGGADPVLHHGPVRLPPDLTGSDEPRDILAAEEFAMPAPIPHVFAAEKPRGFGSGSTDVSSGPPTRSRVVHAALVVGVTATAVLIARRRRRRRA